MTAASSSSDSGGKRFRIAFSFAGEKRGILRSLTMSIAAVLTGMCLTLSLHAEEKKPAVAHSPAALSAEDKKQVALATALDGKADRLHMDGKIPEAEAEYRAALAIRERVLGAEHPATIEDRFHVALMLDTGGRHAESEAEYRTVVALRERVLGAGDLTTLGDRYNLAITLDEQGKFAEAEAEVRAVIAIHERVRGAAHSATLMNRRFLAAILRKQGRHAEEEAEYRRILALREHALGAEHFEVALSCETLAWCLEREKKYKEALPYARRALTYYQKTKGKYDFIPKDAQELVERLEAALAGERRK